MSAADKINELLTNEDAFNLATTNIFNLADPTGSGTATKDQLRAVVVAGAAERGIEIPSRERVIEVASTEGFELPDSTDLEGFRQIFRLILTEAQKYV
jgi:hypothetical protein